VTRLVPNIAGACGDELRCDRPLGAQAGESIRSLYCLDVVNHGAAGFFWAREGLEWNRQRRCPRHLMAPKSPRASELSARISLRRYARVSEAIRSSEFEELLALRNRYGLPLTWSHVEELAEVRTSNLRKQFAEWAISEALSVRDLATRVRRKGGVVAKPY
jgi:hypothetical protein